jgi:hypothetical protein
MNALVRARPLEAHGIASQDDVPEGHGTGAAAQQDKVPEQKGRRAPVHLEHTAHHGGASSGQQRRRGEHDPEQCVGKGPGVRQRTLEPA